jgi:hypothetical protein
MFPDTYEPTDEILHYAYLNAISFPIDFPTETVVVCHYRKQNHRTSKDGYFHKNADLYF